VRPGASISDGPQLPLPLEHREAKGRGDFLVSESNAVAVAWIDRWPEWPQPVLVLSGPRGSGKSHLADVWRQKANAACYAASSLAIDQIPEILRNTGVVVEDIETRSSDQALFHLLNLAREMSVPLLFTSAVAPAALETRLADLASRLNAAPHVALAEPDEALLIQLIAKLFAERGVHAGPAMVEYIVNRVDRSAHAAQTIVERIDRHALSHGRKLNMTVIREVLRDR